MIRLRGADLAGLLPLYFAVATALGFVDYHVRPHPEDGFAKYSPSVVAGTAEVPGRYRILAPYAFDALTRATGLPPRESWVAFRWLCLLGALLAGHVYLSTWFGRTLVAAGNLAMAALLPLTFTNGWAHPDHLMELFLFTLGCACIARGWDAAFGVVLILSALNRETSVFLILLYAFAAPLDRTRAMKALLLGALWTVIFVGLRLRLGYSAYDMWQFTRNLRWLVPLAPNFDPYYRMYGWFFAALIAPLAWMAASTWSHQPRFCKVAAGLVAPAAVVTCFLISSIIETRIFTPVIPLLLPAALRALATAPPEAR